ncbi:MAG: hypothetical protein JWP67_595 [Mucilaginibacter sp.]|nr:hypothetical protein [Mucilaginibacter sp.]MDB5060752.1 hypothetical protein [Mucilaginibacter sp.]
MKCMYPSNESLMKLSPTSCNGACRMYGNQNYVQVSIRALTTFMIKPETKKPSTSKQ